MIKIFNKIYVIYFFSSIALYFLIITIADSFINLNTDFPIGAFEDISLQIVNRILQAKPVYTDPDMNYIPLIYAPAFFYISAIIAKISGLSFFSIRLLSFVSIIAIILVNILIFSRILDNFRKYFYLSLIASSLFFTSLKVTGYWIEFAKIDAFFILNIAILIYFTLLYEKAQSKNLLAILIFFSALIPHVKQTGLIFIVVVVLNIFLHAGIKKSLIYLTGTISLFLIPSVLLELQSANRFFYFVWFIPTTHPLETSGVLQEVVSIQGPMILVFLVTSFFFAREFFQSDFLNISNIIKYNNDVKTFITLFLFAFTGLFISIIGRTKMGAVSNSLLYGYYTLSVFVIWTVSILFKKFENRKILQLLFILLCIILLSFHFIKGHFNIFDNFKQNQIIRKQAIKYKTALCSLKGPILLMNNPYLPKYYCNADDTFTYQALIDIIFDKSSFLKFGNDFETVIPLKKYNLISGIGNTYMPEEESQNMITILKNTLQRENNPKKKLMLESFIYSSKLNLILSKNYKKIPPEKLSNIQKEYIFLSGKLIHPTTFILEPR